MSRYFTQKKTIREKTNMLFVKICMTHENTNEIKLNTWNIVFIPTWAKYVHKRALMYNYTYILRTTHYTCMYVAHIFQLPVPEIFQLPPERSPSHGSPKISRPTLRIGGTIIWPVVFGKYHIPIPDLMSTDDRHMIFLAKSKQHIQS